MATDLGSLVPILHPAGWRGRRRCLTRKLLPTFRSRRMPIVAYGRAGETAAYLSRKHAETNGIDLDRVERKALKNLVTRPGRPGWKPRKVQWGRRKAKVLIRRGDDLTASDLLSGKLLRQAQRWFASERLLVAMPTRKTMIACPEDEELAAGLEEWVTERFFDAEEKRGPALFPLVFTSESGVLVSLDSLYEEADSDEPPVPGDIDSDTAAPGVADDEVTWYRAPPLVVDDDGVGTLVILLTCEGIDELLRAIAYELDAYTHVIGEMAGFEGPIVIRINSSAVPDDAAARHRVERLVDECRGVARKANLRAPNGNRVSIETEWKELEYDLLDDVAAAAAAGSESEVSSGGDAEAEPERVELPDFADDYLAALDDKGWFDAMPGSYVTTARAAVAGTYARGEHPATGLAFFHVEIPSEDDTPARKLVAFFKRLIRDVAAASHGMLPLDNARVKRLRGRTNALRIELAAGGETWRDDIAMTVEDGEEVFEDDPLHSLVVLFRNAMTPSRRGLRIHRFTDPKSNVVYFLPFATTVRLPRGLIPDDEFDPLPGEGDGAGDGEGVVGLSSAEFFNAFYDDSYDEGEDAF